MMPQESYIKFSGLVLQVAGILTVWLGIRETRKLFTHPSFLKKLTDRLRRFPKYKSLHVTASIKMTMPAPGMKAYGYVSEGTGSGTTEERLTALESNLKRARDNVSTLQKSIDDNFRSLTHELSLEKVDRSTADQDIQKLLQNAQTGGIAITAMGAMWLLAGVIMSTISSELELIITAISTQP